MVFLKNSSNLSDVWSYGIIVPAIQDQPCNKLGQIRDLFTYPWRSKRLLGLASKSLHPQIVQLIQKPTQKLKPMQHLVKELAEDIQERWETSDSPVVHKIQDLNDKVFGESATALSFKEIRRRDPSLSWSDFVAERCLAEHKAYERQGTFFENKTKEMLASDKELPPFEAARQIQHHQQQHMMGSGGGGGGQFNDTTFTKIFVGGLGWETQRDTMRKYFEEFGEILEAVVITDKATGRSKGYGFVTFKDAEAAVRACQNPAPVIDGRKANCNLASLGAHKNRPPPPPSYPQEILQWCTCEILDMLEILLYKPGTGCEVL